jgi:hypothetical protein
MPEFKSTEQLRAEALLGKKDKLRDKFAAAALTGLIPIVEHDESITDKASGLAKIAYLVADAMLQAKLNNPLK